MIRAASFAAMVAFIAAPAFAQSSDVDGVISTSSTVSAPMTTDQKIANILAPARAEDAADKAGEIGPRQIHGSASVSVGSDGYRAATVSTVIPIGETGTLGIAYGQSQGGRGFGYGRGPGFGGPGFGPGRRYGTNQALDLSLAYDASKTADECAPLSRDGSRPVEPTWTDELRGRPACAAARRD
jgi:hypothetical protein